jgi:hypothetical protein
MRSPEQIRLTVGGAKQLATIVQRNLRQDARGSVSAVQPPALPGINEIRDIGV